MKTLLSILLLSLIYPGLNSEEPVVVDYKGSIEIRPLEAGKYYLTNRKYMVKRLPRGLDGYYLTALAGNEKKDYIAKVPAGSTVYIGLDSEKNTPDSDAIRKYSSELEKKGWKYFGKIYVSDNRMKSIRVLSKTFRDEEIIDLRGVGFVGSLLIAKKLSMGKI